MVVFFISQEDKVYAVDLASNLDPAGADRLIWLFGGAVLCQTESIPGPFIGPRREMITPWSTNAVEITQNMGILSTRRIELFIKGDRHTVPFDAMLQEEYPELNQQVFYMDRKAEPVYLIDDLNAYNDKEGLALSAEEVRYLEQLSHRLGRKLTDSEIFGFSQVNSEHCRHKIFNGTFIIDGHAMEMSLFQLIRLTTARHRNRVVSAYIDNCAFFEGPEILQFSTSLHDRPDYYLFRPLRSVISLKAETHNFPTTVEPFNGAATGTGGEIRDRVAGGRGAVPLAGTAVYMTAYPRLDGGRSWEKAISSRKWLYQTPQQILIKASNGASDFGNKFGQPLICGSLLTFEHAAGERTWAYDKVIMMAGGVGYGNEAFSLKENPAAGDRIVLLGGDNYRIGMGGGAVSSVATGKYGNAIELNAVQRSNPEMQKRICNAIRALAESSTNPIVSIHDHGAGGHLNCLSELVEKTGGRIDMKQLPVGDPTLSAREIIGNESQERMGLILKPADTELLRHIADRERAPMYVIGEVTGDRQFTFVDKDGSKPIDLQLDDLFGNPPKTVITDRTTQVTFTNPLYHAEKLEEYLEGVLQLESVACKDWLTNKVDRSVTGLVAGQQTCGPIQLPLNNLAVVALDYVSNKGVATSIGHAPAAGLVDPASGSVLSIAEALTNIIWSPIEDGLRGISLSANWMWPCRNPGEDARLYSAVKAASDFAIALGINIPTGKDSLSMSQKYPDGTEVLSPGTVIISAAGAVKDIRKRTEPVIRLDEDTSLVYVDLSSHDLALGGSAFYQSLACVGEECPTVKDPGYFARVFDAVQQFIEDGEILAGHDVSAGGLITCLLEMCFAVPGAGMSINLNQFADTDILKILFSENPSLVIQVRKNSRLFGEWKRKGIRHMDIGIPSSTGRIDINRGSYQFSLSVNNLRKIWFRTSYLLDTHQSTVKLAKERFNNLAKHPMDFTFPADFSGKSAQYGINTARMVKSGIKSAIIREKGVNGDREMAHLMHLAGFDVKDVHMTDLISGRESLEDVNFIVFVGGFSNSDVLGSAKGWAGAFLYNEKARLTLERYYARHDTLSLGVCNGCQLMVELDLISCGQYKPELLQNESGKFESAFLNVDVPENNSVMFGTLSGSRLGIWVAHGEGRFRFSHPVDFYHIALYYSYSGYPYNPNGSEHNVAGIYSADGRHLAIMPHLERAVFPWNWAYYPQGRQGDEITPWVEAFVNARQWVVRVTGSR